MDRIYKLVIAGDFLPSKYYIDDFEKGDLSSSIDGSICEIFHTADFSIVNLEGALTDSDKKQNKVGPVLKSSKQTVKGLRALGVKSVALANNHFTDFLDAGCEDTIMALDENSIMHVGGGSKSHPINTYITVNFGNRIICIYNVSESFYNVLEEGVGANIYDEYLVCEELKRLKKEYDYLIVIYHGGAEMFPYPTQQLRKRFHRMADCGADFITAQHTHCIGCEERYNNSYLLYGQGNFFFPRMKSKIAQQGLITTISFSDNQISINHDCAFLKSGRLEIDGGSLLAGFYERSKNVEDESFIAKKYEDFIDNNYDLKLKYYQAYSGNSILDRLLWRFSPKKYIQKVEDKHSKEQLQRIVFSLESDRMREDVCRLWKTILKSK